MCCSDLVRVLLLLPPPPSTVSIYPSLYCVNHVLSDLLLSLSLSLSHSLFTVRVVPVSIRLFIVSFRIYYSLFTCRSDLVRVLLRPPTPTGTPTPSLDRGIDN